jgi:Histidine kinase
MDRFTFPRRFLWLRFFWVPLLSVLFSGLSYGLGFSDEYGRQLLAIIYDKFALDLLLTALYTLICSEAGLLIFRQLQRYFPIETRLVLLIVIHVFCSTIVWLGTFFLVQWFLYGFDTPAKIFLMKQNVPMALIIALGLNGMYIGMTLLTRWQESVLEAEALKRAHVEAQNAALRQQLDPHFLFNSLNTLTALIEEEPANAVHFVQELSTVYRYVLQNRQQSTINLALELEFVRAYTYLHEIRFGENFHVIVDVPARVVDEHCVPPLVVQLCVENAIKHNVISRQMPLQCWITVEKPYIVVTNNRQSKRSSSDAVHDSIWLGLASIHARYALLTDTPVMVIETESDFIVKLPLLTLDSAESNGQRSVTKPVITIITRIEELA